VRIDDQSGGRRRLAGTEGEGEGERVLVGVEGDPQGLARQRATFEAAGAAVFLSNARAARAVRG